MDRITRYLAMRDHSRHELHSKLSRLYNPEIVEKALNEAAENGWIPPEEELAQRATAAYRHSLKSRRYIEGQLRKKGLPVPPRDDEAEVTAIRTLVERKFGSPSELTFEERTKVYRFLKYRGFDDRGIKQVLNEKP
ncbi:MAG: regulatory protein RecX [Bdellovibrionales bacterium]|nr:regulatory protein RecX [Bdellovibrionales bacterium]